MPAVPETGADEGEGEGVCQFCGGFGPASENELDVSNNDLYYTPLLAN